MSKVAMFRLDTSHKSIGLLPPTHTRQIHCGSLSATGIGSGSSTDCPAVPRKAMNLDVLWQVIAAGKLLFTYRTLVRFHPRVRAPVTGQFIWAGKLPYTARPVTGKWLLSSMSPQVSLKMATLRVHLGTAWKVALVHFDEICHWILLELLCSSD